LTPDKKRLFEQICSAQDLTSSQVARRLIRDYIDQHEALLCCFTELYFRLLALLMNQQCHLQGLSHYLIKRFSGGDYRSVIDHAWMNIVSRDYYGGNGCLYC
jgi:hypothetical protein